MMSREVLLVIGVIFHIVYLFSIFDIYFTSPIVHGMTPQKSPVAAPADRLLLIVGDGLRADKLLELDNGIARAPYLRNIIKTEGSWGVSHTRVPTESRPGHVAIIAGFYEDVSAVTTGWTMNPVNFDSVFNQSEHTWSFGSPDILPMFQHGASDPSRVDTVMYPPEYEDFSGEASHLDTWVFDHFRALFEEAKTNPELNTKLRKPKIVFFLHLLGLDTNGHGFRPHSKEYCENIAMVDKGVSEMVNLVEDFYGHDGRTSFVFTADHGMNNRGAHGDGHPDNTRTPLIAWGAGINKPMKGSKGHDEFSAEWDLSDVQRNDVLQADIAPLMSHLVGIPLPVNSVGELPLNYLDGDEYTKAQAAFANARQIAEQYKIKHDEKEEKEMFFRPFRPLSGSNDPSNYLSQIQTLIDIKDYMAAESLSKKLMSECLAGLRYFQTYDWLFLRGVITAGYVGWCAFCLEFVIRYYILSENTIKYLGQSTSKLIDGMAVLVFGFLSFMVWIQDMPTMYYAYVFFPVYFWRQVLQNKDIFAAILSSASREGWTVLIRNTIGTLLALELLVYSYFRREVLTVCFVLLATWPFFMPARMRRHYSSLLTLWSISCLCTSVFTLLPVEKGENILLVVFGGLAGISVGGFVLAKLERDNRIKRKTSILMKIQLLLNLVSIILVYSTSTSLQKRQGLPVINQLLSWTVMAFSSICPFVYRGPSNEDYLARLLMICLSFAPLMTLLSISYEMLFYVCFCSTVLLWLETERALYRDQRRSVDRPLQTSDCRAVLIFLFFICVGFFGTGNVASLSSFSLESVYRFVTIFNPFLMGVLLIAKILIPFFVASAVLGVLSISLDLSPFSLILAVMSITDVQTINFFYFVKDSGSWLEIGTTISHFCISELFIIFTIILFLLSRLLVGHLVLPKLSSMAD
ncbi:MCD4/FSR2/SSU21/ZRG16 [Phycomyces blakesleeanus]|uniref:GPI ethanolamine phosphate transferase 1 n=1 Tax=Phycomyces blakesleeanus TaxID=4837 RepID=A0ABR3AWP0_PHYBL